MIINNKKVPRNESEYIYDMAYNSTYNESYHYANGLERVTYFNNDDKIIVIIYFKDNIIHRDGDSPSIIQYLRDGNISSIRYCKNDVVHRDGDKPAYISFDPSGTGYYLGYYQKGYKHRNNLEASNILYQFGELQNSAYFINGVEYTKEDIDIIKKRKSIIERL